MTSTVAGGVIPTSYGEGSHVSGVVLTGPPTSGNSTLGKALVEVMCGAFVSFDEFKETLFEESWGRLGGWPLRQAAEERLECELALMAAKGQAPVVDI